MSETKLREILLSDEHGRLLDYGKHLLANNPERNLLLTMHLVVEKLLGDMIATNLSHPECWIEEADFRSKTNLARAMGLIGEEELRICRVLNSSRNAAAHDLAPIPDKWITEIYRIAFGKKASENKALHPQKWFSALRQLLVHISAPWLHANFTKNRKSLRSKHKERWMDLMIQRLGSEPRIFERIKNSEDADRIGSEIDLLLAEEIKSGKIK